MVVSVAVMGKLYVKLPTVGGCSEATVVELLDSVTVMGKLYVKLPTVS